MAKLLLVEDDKVLSARVSRWLGGEGYLVTVAHSSEDALEFLNSSKFDLLVLDWELPGKSGLELCKQVREKDILTPVLFLTGRSAIDDKGAGFESGADDYLTKPFAMQELGFRVKALLWRSTNFEDSNELKVRQLVVEPHKYRVYLNGEEIILLPKEFAVLEFLMRHPGEVFSAKALLDRIWSAETNVSPDTVATFVRRLRKKIDTDPERPLISVIKGVGFRLEP